MPFALGFIGLSSAQFYSYTLREWGFFLRGWNIRRHNEAHEKAVLVANLMASSGNLKKGTSFKSLYESVRKQLLGEDDKDSSIPHKQPMSGKELEDFKRRFGVS